MWMRSLTKRSVGRHSAARPRLYVCMHIHMHVYLEQPPNRLHGHTDCMAGNDVARHGVMRRAECHGVRVTRRTCELVCHNNNINSNIACACCDVNVHARRMMHLCVCLCVYMHAIYACMQCMLACMQCMLARNA